MRGKNCAAGTVLLAGTALCAGTAQADDLVAVRPGVMCASADALSRLTLPNGDSRTHAAAPRPQDLAAAASGGCIDIPRGARVTVQQAYFNTSIVTYAGPGAPPDGRLIVPNVDFDHAGTGISAQPPPRQQALPQPPLPQPPLPQPPLPQPPPRPPAPITGLALPAGYGVTRRVPAGAAGTVVVLEDQRLTPELQRALWGREDPEVALEAGSPGLAELTRRPLGNAQIWLVSPSGELVARRALDVPQAKVEPAPLHGLPAPAFFLTMDYAVGMGGFNGPTTELIVPTQHQLRPVEATRPDGSGDPISLALTMHAAWKVVPNRDGQGLAGRATEEIESVYCGTSRSQPVQAYETYRFVNGAWTVATRLHGECGSIEEFPPRREFP